MTRFEVSSQDYGERNAVESVFQIAKRKSRYGRRDWIVWRERSGKQVAETFSAEAVKKAMLACGTAGHFFRLSGGISYLVGWRSAVIMWRNAR